jgi:hypothetical protein
VNTVYAYLDGDEIVYVGCTNNPKLRQWHHRRYRSWWSADLTFRILAQEDDRKKAEGIERGLIQRLTPRFNIANNPDHLASVARAGGWIKCRPYTETWVGRAMP